MIRLGNAPAAEFAVTVVHHRGIACQRREKPRHLAHQHHAGEAAVTPGQFLRGNQQDALPFQGFEFLHGLDAETQSGGLPEYVPQRRILRYELSGGHPVDAGTGGAQYVHGEAVGDILYRLLHIGQRFFQATQGQVDVVAHDVLSSQW